MAYQFDIASYMFSNKTMIKKMWVHSVNVLALLLTRSIILLYYYYAWLPWVHYNLYTYMVNGYEMSSDFSCCMLVVYCSSIFCGHVYLFCGMLCRCSASLQNIWTRIITIHRKILTGEKLANCEPFAKLPCQ